jgi:hypothetical protein
VDRAAAHRGIVRRDRGPSPPLPAGSSGEPQAAAGDAGGGGVSWGGPRLRAEDEHAVIVAALAHVVGAGTRSSPPAGLGQQGTCPRARGARAHVQCSTLFTYSGVDMDEPVLLPVTFV